MLHLKEVRILSDEFPTRDYYPFNLGVLQQTETIPFSSSVTFLIGENGSGKSTLLEALTHRCGIYIWSGEQRSRCEINPFEDKLFLYLKAEWTDGIVPGSFFSSQIFRNFAQIVDEWEADNPGQIDYFGGKSLLTQSHGQSLMSFFKARYKIKGLYLLDEPETALSPKSQLEFLRLLQETGQRGQAQFIIATHSPLLLAYPGGQIFSFDSPCVGEVEYEDTAHYKLYKQFFTDRTVFLEGC